MAEITIDNVRKSFGALEVLERYHGFRSRGRGWHREHERVLRFEPSRSDLGQTLRRRRRPPTSHEIDNPDPCDGRILRHVRRNRDEGAGSHVFVQMHEGFQRGERERRRGVDDGSSGTVPAAAAEARAFTVEGAPPCPRDAPDADQL